MTLRQKFLATVAVLVGVMACITLVAYGVMQSSTETARDVAEEYAEMQQLDRALAALGAAEGAADGRAPDRELVASKLDTAAEALVQFAQSQPRDDDEWDSHHAAEARAGRAIVERIRAARMKLRGEHAVPAIAWPAIAQTLKTMEADLRELAREADTRVHTAIRASHEQVEWATGMIIACCVAGGVIGVGLALMQYRSVMRPIERLHHKAQAAVRRWRPGQPTEPVARAANDPVEALGRDFASIVRELESACGELDERIEAKSRELIQSERLASVGYLAAGVAHEINNPLNSILGYTELTLRALPKHEHEEAQTNEATASLEVVREEAMRCRGITEKLLSLVRNSDAPREWVDLAAVAQEVITVVEGLPQFRNQSLTARLDEPLWAHAHEAEMKQVLLNLVVNALEAVENETCHVEVRGQREQDQIVLEVIDNGRGMSEEDRGRVFDPFFTTKRGSQRNGTGLGLSIAHAIVREHGGTLTASSDGPGQGSRFSVRIGAPCDKQAQSREQEVIAV